MIWAPETITTDSVKTLDNKMLVHLFSSIAESRGSNGRSIISDGKDEGLKEEARKLKAAHDILETELMGRLPS